MLEALIRSKTTRKILAILFSNPADKFYMRQLERIIDEPISAVRRELKKLEKAGFLITSDEGRLKYFSVNKANPIYEELKKIVLKTQSIGETLRSLVKKTAGIKIAFIYGSVAKGGESVKSDIDLMIIGDIDGVKLHSRINEIEDKIKRPINYNLINEKEFKTKKSDFLKRVLKEKKIFLIGDEFELKRLAQAG